jgi:hypothetical protein
MYSVLPTASNKPGFVFLVPQEEKRKALAIHDKLNISDGVSNMS